MLVCHVPCVRVSWGHPWHLPSLSPPLPLGDGWHWKRQWLLCRATVYTDVWVSPVLQWFTVVADLPTHLRSYRTVAQ